MSTTPPDKQFELHLPDWVPAIVRITATNLYQRQLSQGTSDHLDLLKRLTSDERMKKVWLSLQSKRLARSASADKFASPMHFYFNCLAEAKRKKAAELRERGGDFGLATAQLLENEASRLDRPTGKSSDALSEQECALHCFFYGAYHIARDLEPLYSREELGKIHKDYKDLRQQLKDLAGKLHSIGMGYYADQLEPIASEVEDRESWLEIDYEDSGMKVVDRRRSDEYLQSYVVQLATITRVVFGDPLYGTLAATANAALNLKTHVDGTVIRRTTAIRDPQEAVSLPIVRQILRAFPYSALGGDSAIPWD
jgi:hypothetical protein